MSRERALNFDQWHTFSGNYKPIRVWLWVVYKIIKNKCHLRLFAQFIQTQKRYPISLDNLSILTWRIFVTSIPQEVTPCDVSHTVAVTLNYFPEFKIFF